MKVLLSTTGLHRHYRNVHAVNGVDLCVEEGARHALIGANGAGKTTLLRLLAGTTRPTSGRIHLAGVDITRTGPARRSRLGIARSFQTPALAHSLSVLDNLVLAAWRHTGPLPWLAGRHQRLRQRALNHLDLYGLAAHATQAAGSLPHGLQRLLDIAMATITSPRLLLLDEPAAGLDRQDQARLLRLLGGIEVTTLLVEHNLELVHAWADTVTVLDHGRVLATASPTELAHHPTVAATLPGEGR